MRLNTTLDIDTDDPSSTVSDINDALGQTNYRLSVTADSVRLYASAEADTDGLEDAIQTMVSEVNEVGGASIERDDIEVSGGV